MHVDKLLRADLGTRFTVFTEPFTLESKLTMKLEGGLSNYWFFDGERMFLAVDPEAEEIIIFSPVESQIEKDDDIVVEGGKDHEFSYEDHGTVDEVEGDAPFDQGDELSFTDYEADDGSRIRIITNDYNGEEKIFSGQVVTDDDIRRKDEEE